MNGQGEMLVVDQGSHASRALQLAADGRVIGSGEAGVPAREPGPGRCEPDAEAIVDSVRRAVGEALAGRRPGDGVVAALATQRSTIACWDRETGEALAPVISWRDRRNARWIESLAPDPGEVRRVTGLVPSPHYGASKLRWCLDHQPRVSGARAAGRLCLGPLSSFLLFRLLEGRPFVVDPANASRTLLWDVTTGEWSPRMLDLFGIPADCLPRCVPSRHAFGALRLGGGEIPLRVCTGDQAAALFARGEPRRDTAYVNIGTGGFVQRPFDAPAGPVDGLLESVAWRDGDDTLRVLEGTVNGAGAAVTWLAGDLGIPETSLVEAAAAWMAEASNPPLFVNGVGGLGAPWWVPDCPVRFEGEGGPAEKTVAVLESIAFLLRANLEAMDAAAGPVTRLVVTGGLSRLDGLCARLASLAGVPAERPAETEATAAGLAFLLSGRSRGEGGSPDVFEPRPDPALAGRYARWREAMETAIRG